MYSVFPEFSEEFCDEGPHLKLAGMFAQGI
jgi:hypothetical protein